MFLKYYFKSFLSFQWKTLRIFYSFTSFALLKSLIRFSHQTFSLLFLSKYILFCEWIFKKFYSTSQFVSFQFIFIYASPNPSIKLPKVTTEISREISPKMILLSFPNLDLSCEKRNFSENHFPYLSLLSLVILSSIFTDEAYSLLEVLFVCFISDIRASKDKYSSVHFQNGLQTHLTTFNLRCQELYSLTSTYL